MTSLATLDARRSPLTASSPLTMVYHPLDLVHSLTPLSLLLSRSRSSAPGGQEDTPDTHSPLSVTSVAQKSVKTVVSQSRSLEQEAESRNMFAASALAMHGGRVWSANGAFMYLSGGFLRVTRCLNGRFTRDTEWARCFCFVLFCFCFLVPVCLVRLCPLAAVGCTSEATKP